MKKVYCFMILCCALMNARGQTTYTWNQPGGTADWLLSSNWTPARNSPATNDIIVFNNGANNTVYNVPQETVGQLLLSNNTTVNLQSGMANNTFTIGGGAGTDLSVVNGSALNINGGNALFITLLTGSTGNITGNMTFSAGNHTLNAADASAITFVSPAVFTQGAGCTGSVFTTGGTASAVSFNSGSAFVQNAGSPPFGLAQPNSKVVFQTGSLYKYQQSGLPSFSGRTYANLEINNAAFSQSPTGGDILSMDNLTITDGTLNLNLTGGINIKGNISVAAGEVLTFSPASANTLTFNGSTGSQTVSNFGTLTFAANTAVVIANTSATPVIFFHPQTIAGSMTVNAGSSLETRATLTLTGTPAINGSFQLYIGGWATGGVWSYGAGGTLVFNNMSSSYVVNNDAYWPAVNGPVNVTVKNTGGITMNVGRTVSGLFQTSAGVINANNLTFNGTARINTGGSFTGRPNYGPSSTLLYNTGGVYGRSDEWNCSAGLGCPNNLQISNNTILNVPNGAIFTQGQIQGNLTIDAGSAMYMDYGAIGQNQVVEVYKDVNLSGSLSLGDAIGGDLHVKGNWNIAPGGIFNPNGRAVVFNASSGDQTVSGATTFDYLTIAKPAGDLVLSDHITCNQTVTLSGGKVVLGSKNLIAGAVSGGSASSYIKTNGSGALTIKNIGVSDKFFIIGNTTYNQVIIGNGSGHDWTVRVEDGLSNVLVPYNTNKAVLRTWTITPSVNPPSAGATIIFGYNDGDGSQLGSGFVNVEPVQLWHFNGISWMAASGAITPGGVAGNPRTVTKTNWSQFSSFAIANISGPLPVSLLHFSGYKDSFRNQLNWTTLSEINNNGFEVLRSVDGINFMVIGIVKSRAPEGNSNEQLHYSYTDNNLSGSTHYYRLRQLDNNGSNKLSHIILIRSEKPAILTMDGLYPNPATVNMNVALNSPRKGVVSFSIIDMTGKVMAQELRAVTDGSNVLSVNVASLKNGSYLLKVTSGEFETVILKFVKF